MKFKYDMDALQKMNLFEKVTKAKLKDMFIHNEKIHFIVANGELYKALGKDKANVTKLEGLLKKKVKIVEYSDDLLKFVVNIMAPLKVVDIKNDDNVITITGPDQKTKGLMIGARAQNLRMFEGVIQKYFPELKEIKVI